MRGGDDPARGTPEDRLRLLGDPDADPGAEVDLGSCGADPGPGVDPGPGAHLRAALAAAPPPPPPPAVLARLDRALAAEAARATARRTATARTGSAPPGCAPPGSAPPGSRGRARPRAGTHRAVLVAAAVLLVAALGTGTAALAGFLGPPDRGPAPVAAPRPGLDAGPRPPSPPGAGEAGAGRVLAARSADLPAALAAGLAGDDYGVLADPARRASCLRAHGLPPGAPVGARRVVLDGRPGVLLVLTTGTAARFRVLVVGDGCAADDPATLADAIVGR